MTRVCTSLFSRRNWSMRTLASRASAVPSGWNTVILTGLRTFSSTSLDTLERVNRPVDVRSTRAWAGTGTQLRPTAATRATTGTARARVRSTMWRRAIWAATAMTRLAAVTEPK
jgi:hypothetical protein